MYPISIKLTDRRVAVVGGGRVALRKLRRLVAEGAEVTVLSLSVLPEIKELAEAGEIVWLKLAHDEFAWQGSDFTLVFAATDDFAANKSVSVQARKTGALVNNATEPEDCDFFVPASIKRGDLELTVATGGASPALARLIRQDMEKRYHEDFGHFLAWLKTVRQELMVLEGDTKARQQLWRQAMDESLFELILEHGLERAKDEVRRKIGSLGAEP